LHRDVEILFHELVDLSPEQRENYLRERQLPSEVRAEVEELLRFDPEVDHELTNNVAAYAEQLLRTRFEAREGGRCGPYQLIRLLGSGGMGSVYLAERADGEVEQRVAIKLLRFSAQDAAFQDRFLQERQILARLNHPGIARLLDAGHASDGQPYLAMDYIDGSPIDQYAESLSLREKLLLFIDVCGAISYAHRNLIIHRDLKPSNILVDGSGHPKLLDFGIAKILDAGHEQTQAGDQLLTPEYASPEQIRGSAQTTSTDIYSLGAVLYKLLTGRSQHASPSQTRAELTAAICGKEPESPSRLNRELPRDLDFILGKALRKEPEERYASVEGFAEDLRAFLEWRPVRARSGNAWYRIRKFARRYWAPVTAGTVAVAGLSIGFYIANHERAIAERRFGQLRQLSSRIFDLDTSIRDLEGSTAARQRLVSVSLEYLEGLAPDARGDVDLAEEIGRGYLRVGEIQGVPTNLNLGEFDKAQASLKRADEFIETVLAARPGNRSALLDSADIAQSRMILADSEHRRQDALDQGRRAAERTEAAMRTGETSETERKAAARLYANVALAHLNQHSFDDAVRYARKAVDEVRTVGSAKYELTASLSVLSNALRSQGELEGGLKAIEEARAGAEAMKYPTQTQRGLNLYGIYLREGLILGEDGGVNLGRTEDAIAAFQKAFDVTQEMAAKDPKDYTSRSRQATAARELGNILRYSDPKRAIEVYDAGVQALGTTPNNLKAQRDRAVLLANSSYALRRAGRGSEARKRIDAALTILKEMHDYPADKIGLGRETYIVLRARAEDLAETGDRQHAMEIYQELVRKITASRPDPQNDLRDAAQISEFYAALGGLYRQLHDSSNAQGMDAQRRELWQAWNRKLPDNPFVLRQIAEVSHK
jgi:serine/threonine protein kinase